VDERARRGAKFAGARVTLAAVALHAASSMRSAPGGGLVSGGLVRTCAYNCRAGGGKDERRRLCYKPPRQTLCSRISGA